MRVYFMSVAHMGGGALRITPDVHPHLPPCLRQSGLLFITTCARLAAQSFRGFSCLYLPSPSRNVGIIHAMLTVLVTILLP